MIVSPCILCNIKLPTRRTTVHLGLLVEITRKEAYGQRRNEQANERAEE